MCKLESTNLSAITTRTQFVGNLIKQNSTGDRPGKAEVAQLLL